MPLRCLLVDGNDAFLKAATALLEREGMAVAGVTSNSADALRQAVVDLRRMLTGTGYGPVAEEVEAKGPED
jgi:hypothetical protein